MSSVAARLLLIDNDAFVLLAGSGHLEKVLEALDLTIDDCRYNAPFPFVFRKKIKPKLPASVADRIEAAIDRIRPLELQPHADVEQQLLSEDEIDAGEAVLFGVLAGHTATLLTTSDKRALRALSSAPALATIKQVVKGRIIAVESLIKHLADQHSVPAIADGFVEVSVTDTRLSVIFSDHNLAHPDQCREAIESYLRDALADCGEDLFLVVK